MSEPSHPDERWTGAAVPRLAPVVGLSDAVWRWRFQCALALGFTVADAALVAHEGLDLHEVESLIRRGCRPALALRILR